MSDSRNDPEETLFGTVTEVHRTHCRASVAHSELQFHIPGRIIRDAGGKNPVRIGDRVLIGMRSGTLVLNRILPRKSKLTRTMEEHGSVRTRSELAVNLALAMFVLPVTEHSALQIRRFRLLDRMLVGAQYAGINASICVNKLDLLEEQSGLDNMLQNYSEIDYPVLKTTALTGEGIDALKSSLPTGLTALVGPSGSGKTSIVRALTGRSDLTTLSINTTTSKGRHATSSSKAYDLGNKRWVVDVPGLRTFGVDDVPTKEIAKTFREFQAHTKNCQDQFCTHVESAGCAVKRAVDDNKISSHRYDSYLRMMVF